MRRFKRNKRYEVNLDIKAEAFINPPRESQRQWLVNRALSEFCWDLEALDKIAQQFVPGSTEMILSDRNLKVSDPDEIMEMWQLPIMQCMADKVASNGGDILEIGFGLGMSANMIQAYPVKSHTIVECVDNLAEQCRNWGRGQACSEVKVLQGRWEDLTHEFKTYDGIFFHTYPMDSVEYAELTRNYATVAQPFFEVAARHLKSGGVFSYFTNEIDSLSRSHQRALLRHFPEVNLQAVRHLDIPENVKDAWWIDQMIVVTAKAG